MPQQQSIADVNNASNPRIFKDRIYRLTVQKSADNPSVALLYEGQFSDDNALQVVFNVEKNADSKQRISNGAVRIYNLSHTSRESLQEGMIIRLEVGYRSTGLVELINADLVSVEHEKSGPTWITMLTVAEGHKLLTQVQLAETISPNTPVAQTLEVIREAMPGIARGTYALPSTLATGRSGYVLSGTPRQCLDQICEAHDLQWNITRDTLTVTDRDGTYEANTSTAPLISPETGMVGSPHSLTKNQRATAKDKKAKPGIRVTSLINPQVRPAGIIRVESQMHTGFYRVAKINFDGDWRGNAWYMHIEATEIDSGITQIN